MRIVAFVSFIIIFGSSSTSALSPGERDLLGEVLDVCGGVTRWSTFSTNSTFHRSVRREGRVQRVEDEDTVAQLQKKERGNYAAYVKANRKDRTFTYFSPGWFRVVDDFLNIEIMQGGDFLLKVVEASDQQFWRQIHPFSEWFQPSDSDFKGRLPIGGEFADHVSLGLGRPNNLKEANLESVEEVAGKELDGVDARCIEASFKPHRRYNSKSRSMTFCFSDGKLMEVTEKVDSKSDEMRDPGASEVHSTAVRSYVKINMAVYFPFEPAPFSLPREKQVMREEEENPLLPSVSIRSFWVYLLVCGAGLGVLALVVSLISYSEITTLWAIEEEEPLLGAGNPAEVQAPSDDGPPLLV